MTNFVVSTECPSSVSELIGTLIAGRPHVETNQQGPDLLEGVLEPYRLRVHTRQPQAFPFDVECLTSTRSGHLQTC